jgi:hypothetical protein
VLLRRARELDARAGGELGLDEDADQAHAAGSVCDWKRFRLRAKLSR